MKKLFFFLMLPLFFVACSSDDDNNDDNDIKTQIIGKWNITHIDMGTGIGYVEIPAEMAGTYATFSSDGKFFGTGYYGNGEGTYTISGKTIKCYVDGELFVTYDIISLTPPTAELKMSQGIGSIKVKCKKE